MIINLFRSLKHDCLINCAVYRHVVFVTCVRSAQPDTVIKLHKMTLKYKLVFEISSEMHGQGHVSLTTSKPVKHTETVFGVNVLHY
jgi:hypothetical protein